MSTKIYQGFRFSSNNLHDISFAVDRIRPYILKQARAMKDAYLKIDSSSGWHKRRAEIKRTGQRDPAVDTQFQIVFIPHRESPLDYCYGIVYCEHARWYQRWLRVPGVCDFSYWNNTDKPDRISSYAWSERARIWNEVLPGRAVPAVRGFAIDVIDWYF